MFLLSRLMWPRGLKSCGASSSGEACVEAYVASWIEIEQGSQTPSSTTVEAYVASWIEIQTQRPAAGRKKSRLMWPRGLKCY